LLIALSARAAAPGVDQTIRDFVHAFAGTDISAFNAIADVSPVTDPQWEAVRSHFIVGECATIAGYRTRVISATDREVRVIVDIDGTVTVSGNQRVIPVKTPWTLLLRRGDRGWKVGQARITASAVYDAFMNGADLCARLREGEDLVSPSFLAYTFANKGSSRVVKSGRNAEAIDYAEALAREAGDDAMVAFCDSARSRMAWGQREFPRALAYGEKGLSAARAAGDPDTIAAALFILSFADQSAGHPDRALAELAEAQAMFPKLNNTRIAVQSAVTAADLHLLEHQYREAIAAAHAALDLTRRHRYAWGEEAALNVLGRVHAELRDYAVARKYYEQKVALTRSLGDGDPDGFAGLARTEDALGDTKRALEHFRIAIQRSEGFGGIPIRTLYAEALTRQGRYAEAEELLRDALKLANDEARGLMAAEALTALSVVRLRQHRYDDALRVAREAIAKSVEKDSFFSHLSQWPARAAMAEALNHLGRTKEAIAAFQQTLDDIEMEQNVVATTARESIRFQADKTEPYHGLIRLYLRLGRIEEALAVAERMRGALLVDAADQQELSAALTPEERQRETRLETKVAEINRALMAAHTKGDAARVRALRHDLESARLELQQFDEESGMVHAAAGPRQVAAGRLDVALPRRLAGGAAVQYVVTEQSVIVFTLRGSDAHRQVTARVLPISRKKLVQRVDDYCRKLRSRDLAAAADARALYAQLLAPIEPALRGARTIAIIPDAELWRLPFHALLRPDGRYVIERAGVVYASSLGMLQRADRKRAHPPAKRTLLAFGNPIVGGATAAKLRDVDQEGILGPLPDAEHEVQSIAALYGRNRSDVRVGSAASEGAFKEEAPRYDVLHLATHGYLDDQSPMYSALVLAAARDNPADDGLLETHEILRMHLRAEMAVLAACNTGRGATEPGGGVIGISWAFLVAGCPTTVVTQWEASSSTSARLMIAFHRNLTRGESSVEALRHAELSLLRDVRYRHPFYWAPFIVVGAP